ncbi:MAG: dihydroorotase [Eggerthellaceae bacterium]|nr:dihydroorotase [Eggerthellaceae bacterium]
MAGIGKMHIFKGPDTSFYLTEEDEKLLAETSLPSAEEMLVLPGFCDVHVHFREPGFSYKETIKTGTMAAAHGGYTSVCTMPNLNPVPDSYENLKAQLDLIEKDACIPVYPYGSITRDEQGSQLSDMKDLSPYVIAFSDDGRGVQNQSVMKQAMETAKGLNKLIVAHCEDNSLLNGGYIHDGVYAKTHNHKGICSKSEWGQIERDVEMAGEAGCGYHVCHISCKESVEIIRQAKKSGIDVTCETAPHYLLLDENDLRESGAFKMNPPIRSAKDKEALIEGAIDGTIDMISTDHAPHTTEEKQRGLKGSPFGIVGLETAFPMLYTKLVKQNIISLEKLMDLLSYNARKRFAIPANGFCVWDISKTYAINPDEFLSMGRSTPFAGEMVAAKCLMTVSNHKVVYKA